jgi:hypothetical protein
MNKSSTCNFMYGELTSADTQVKIRDALENCHIEQVEVLLYKKNSMLISSLEFLSKISLCRNTDMGIYANSSDNK